MKYIKIIDGSPQPYSLAQARKEILAEGVSIRRLEDMPDADRMSDGTGFTKITNVQVGSSSAACSCSMYYRLDTAGFTNESDHNTWSDGGESLHNSAILLD